MITEPFDSIIERATARLDQEHINAAAFFAAEKLIDDQVAIIRLTPGDMTLYSLLVTPKHVDVFTDTGTVTAREYCVILATSWGKAYPWNGERVHAQYVHEKWVEGHSPHTAAVLAAFLNAIAARFETLGVKS